VTDRAKLTEDAEAWMRALLAHEGRPEWKEIWTIGDGVEIGRTLKDLLSLVASLEQQLRVANENVRVREESQIPMIPRAAHAKMERLERKLAERDEALREMREALEAISEVASVAHNGDPWYCENEGIDAEAAFTKVRAALARESEEQ
jgi:hypothetical protein